MDSEVRRAVADSEEAHVAELIERLELQADELARLTADNRELRGEREALRHDLRIAQAWVRELAERMEEAEELLGARGKSDAGAT